MHNHAPYSRVVSVACTCTALMQAVMPLPPPPQAASAKVKICVYAGTETCNHNGGQVVVGVLGEVAVCKVWLLGWWQCGCTGCRMLLHCVLGVCSSMTVCTTA